MYEKCKSLQNKKPGQQAPVFKLSFLKKAAAFVPPLGARGPGGLKLSTLGKPGKGNNIPDISHAGYKLY